jgi:ribosomal protein S18 acetylase RimI-like enzyme
MADISGWKVEVQDIPSIGTLHARAFHPTMEWHRKNFPSSMAPWWEAKYALDVDNPDCYLLKISSPESSSTVLGLLSLRKYKADERGAGRWSSFPPPPEIDRAAFDGVVNSMIEHRERLMLGRPHFVIDHLGVDHENRGQGLGSKLLARACEVADQEQLDIFVEANEFAESFYQKFGFKTEERLKMPGGLTECFLVRHFGK